MVAHNLMVNSEELLGTKHYPSLYTIFRKNRYRYNGVRIYFNAPRERYFYCTQINKIRKGWMTSVRNTLF